MEKLEDFLWPHRIKTQKNKILRYSHYLVIHKNIKIFVQQKIVQKIGTAVTNSFHRLSSKAINSSFHFCLVCIVNQSVILLQWTTQNRASMINLSVRLSSLVCHCPYLCSESWIISITHGQDYVESSEIRQIKCLSSEFWLSWGDNYHLYFAIVTPVICVDSNRSCFNNSVTSMVLY